MKKRYKVILVLLVLVVLSQLPFAYNRYSLSRVDSLIASQNRKRSPAKSSGFREYKGIIHVHTVVGGDGNGTYEGLVAGAKANGDDFVFVTEHTSQNRDTAGKALNGIRDGIVFIGGHESSVIDENRFVFEGFEGATKSTYTPTNEFIREAHNRGKLVLVTHPERNIDFENDADGFEVINLHTSAEELNKLHLVFDGLWSFGAYPSLTIARHLERPDKNLETFDELTFEERLTLYAATDAHENFVLQIGSDPKDLIADIKLDSYASLFRIMSNHVLLRDNKTINRDTLTDAIRDGKLFIGLDVLGDSSGFRFETDFNGELSTMGDVVDFSDGGFIRATAPIRARFLVLRNGERFFESQETNEIKVPLKTPGTYRIEVYNASLGSPFDKIPWIISNPIYIR